MSSLVGVWKLVDARAFGDAGQELPPPLGPQPTGLAFFEAERMVGIIGDARPSVPAEGPMRPFPAHTGNYSFDDEVLITKADDASRPELVVEQARKVRFNDPDRITVTLTSGVPGCNDINVIWERVG